MTQLDLAQKTELSEAAVRSYKLGTRNPKDAHHEAIAEALGVSAGYLQEHDGYHESEIVHFLMEMEDAGFLRPVLIDGTAYIMPVRPGESRGLRSGVGRARALLALRRDQRGGIPPLEVLLRPRRRAKTHRERGHKQPFRLGQG